MSELKPYPKYKDSGVEWIGDIPIHWDRKKLKYIGKSIIGLTYSPNDVVSEDSGVLVLRASNIVGGKIVLDRKDNVYVNLDIPDKLKTKQGDILICSRSGSRDLIGKSGFIDRSSEGNSFGAFTTIFRSYYNEFVYYVFQSPLFKSEIGSFLTSTINQLTIGSLNNLSIIFPTFSEQRTISNYLNKKTSQIDSLIADKERLIELLEEKRQAVITETVTKGLDPNVKMKDSGIEWIGEIPEHWEVRRLKHLCTLNPPKSEVDKSCGIDVSFIPMENLKSTGKVDISLTRKISEVYDGYTYFKDNDIIMAKVTPCFENGNIAIVNNLENGIGFGTTEFHVLRVKENINIQFLYYLLQSEHFKQAGISSMYGVAGLKRIPTQFILDYRVGLPALKEQIEIAKYLLDTDKEIESLIALQKNVIEKLKEYRESLIYEAITGKIDLRNYEDEHVDIEGKEEAEWELTIPN